jgi:MATE family multidrug resistance protein
MLANEDAALIINTREQTQNESPNEQPLSNITLIKHLSKTTWPLVFTGFMLAGEGFAKAYIISKAGQNAMAADSLLQTTFSLMVMDSGFLNPLSALIAQEFGRQNYEKIGQYVRQGWLLSLILCTPAMSVLLAAEPILNLLGQDREITSLVGPYARVYSFACPAIFGIFVDSALLMSTSRVKSIIPFHIASALIDIGVSFLLINGRFGFPDLGVTGSGYGILFQSWLIWISLKLYFLRNEFNSYKLFNFREMDFNLLLQTIKLGVPITVASLLNQVSYFLIGMMTGKLGSLSLAINNVAKVYLGLFVPIDIGINQASQILISQSKGRKDYAQMRRYGKLGVTIEGLLNTIPVGIYCIFPIQLVSLFIPRENIQGHETTVRLSFVTVAISKLLLSIQGPIIGNLNGLLDTYFPAIVQVICSLAIILPLSYLMAFTFNWELVGINAAACIGTAISIIPLLYRWHVCSHRIEDTSEPINQSDLADSQPVIVTREPDEEHGRDTLISAKDDSSNSSDSHNDNGRHSIWKNSTVTMYRATSDREDRERLISPQIDVSPTAEASTQNLNP